MGGCCICLEMYAALLHHACRKVAKGRIEVNDSYAGKFMALINLAYAYGYHTFSVTPGDKANTAI